jgi:hypothetical protein
MATGRKTAWWNLAIGLIFLFTAARNQWAPGLLSINGRHHDILLPVVCAALFLTAACLNFMRMRPSATR